MGILNQVDHNCNATLSKSKIPDYARDYRNEYLFIRGIDKTCDGLEMKLYDEDKEIFKSTKVDKIKRLIHKFEKAQKLGYLKNISDKDIYESDVFNSISLYESLIDMGDYYYNYDTEYDQKIFEKLIDADFPGYIDFVRSIELFDSKFRLHELDISSNKINWYDSDSDNDDDDNDKINFYPGMLVDKTLIVCFSFLPRWLD